MHDRQPYLSKRALGELCMSQAARVRQLLAEVERLKALLPASAVQAEDLDQTAQRENIPAPGSQ